MKDLDWELFDRYLAKDLTPGEREEFERWVSQRPDRAEFVAAWHRALEKLENGVAAEDRKAVWAGALEQVGAAAVPTSRPNERPRSFALLESRTSPWRRRSVIAAAALLVAGAGLASRVLLTNRPGSADERVVTVPRGQRTGIRLADGSQVTLAAGSTLRHPVQFPSHSREVTLEGEAYFVVEHDTERPFRVRAGPLLATDLGTEFLVRAYPEDAGPRVVVRSGEVAMRAERGASSQEQVIGPGQQGRLEASGETRVEQADTAASFAWTRGTLVFDGTPLREALPQLSRWYDLEFRLADSSLATIPLSGRLDGTLTQGRLEMLAGSLGLSQTRQGGVVVFSRP